MFRCSWVPIFGEWQSSTCFRRATTAGFRRREAWLRSAMVPLMTSGLSQKLFRSASLVKRGRDAATKWNKVQEHLTFRRRSHFCRETLKFLRLLAALALVAALLFWYTSPIVAPGGSGMAKSSLRMSAWHLWVPKIRLACVMVCSW